MKSQNFENVKIEWLGGRHLKHRIVEESNEGRKVKTQCKKTLNWNNTAPVIFGAGELLTVHLNSPNKYVNLNICENMQINQRQVKQPLSDWLSIIKIQQSRLCHLCGSNEELHQVYKASLQNELNKSIKYNTQLAKNELAYLQKQLRKTNALIGIRNLLIDNGIPAQSSSLMSRSEPIVYFRMEDKEIEGGNDYFVIRQVSTQEMQCYSPEQRLTTIEELLDFTDKPTI